MGTVLASAIVSKASIQLIDTSNVRWPQAELLGWLNNGQQQIAQLDPSSANSVAPLKLTSGTRQHIPTDGFIFFEAYRNLGSDGTTPGRVIRMASRQLLDAYNRDWHTTTPSPVTQAYLFNPIDNKAFYVYPPSDGTNYIEINYAKTPADIALTDPITLPDIYQNALLDYIMGRAYSKDTEVGSLTVAQAYFQSFTAEVEASKATQTSTDASKALAPGAA
jgi:hypothetical protein